MQKKQDPNKISKRLTSFECKADRIAPLSAQSERFGPLQTSVASHLPFSKDGNYHIAISAPLAYLPSAQPTPSSGVTPLIPRNKPYQHA